MRDVLSVLHDLQGDLSKSERILSNLIHADAAFVTSAGITDVAERAGVSPPTVTRFCRRLGCDSFTAFKVQLAQAALAGKRYLYANAASAAPVDIADSLLAHAQEAIHSARDGLDLDELRRVADHIVNAGLVAAFGSGGTSSMIAVELQNRLFRLGAHTVAMTDHAMQLMQAATLKRGDVVLASSVSGRNTALIRALEVARAYGATTIVFTRPGRPVSEAADITIGIDLPEGTNILRPSSSRYAFLFVIDLLSTFVAMNSQETARESLRRIKHQLTNNRDTDDREVLGD